ncbi:right-handed parallel beta-helix repeat-containing protein [Candidatus Pacearchaeota archaeon]|nr:right-handed parallel beta-helix repeat-containing protein [Candidatus Pacearchaeota archaeon]
MKKIISLLMVLFLSVNVFGAPATMYVTVAGAGNNDGLTWDNALSLALWETDIEDNSEAGDIYYMEAGTYTLNEGLDMTSGGSNKNGTAALPIKTIGVVGAEAADAEPPGVAYYATGTDRPDIVCGANIFGFGAYWVIRNFDITITENNGLEVESFCVVDKVTVVATGTRAFFSNGEQVTFMDCDGTGGSQVIYTGKDGRVIGCRCSGSPTGIFCGGSQAVLVGNKIDDCPIGIDVDNEAGIVIINNTLRGDQNADVGITASTGTACIVQNNLIDTFAIGAEWDTPSPSNIFDYNCWANNTDDVEGVEVIWGPHRVENANTQILNAGLDLIVGSVCQDVGLQITSGTGNDEINIGADQETSASSGNPRHGTKNGGKQ